MAVAILHICPCASYETRTRAQVRIPEGGGGGWNGIVIFIFY